MSTRTWAIGDIHGEPALLSRQLSHIERRRQPGDTLVFLGDYIDRGPDSRVAVDVVLAEYDIAPDRTVLLWGNHEDMAAESLGCPSPILEEARRDGGPEAGLGCALGSWLRNGGTSTLRDWGITPEEIEAGTCPDNLRRLFSLCRLHYIDGSGLIFVHGGLRRGLMPEQESATNLLWLRPNQYGGDPARPIVVGHTPQDSWLAMIRADMVVLDGGAGKGESGKLWSALFIDGQLDHLYGVSHDGYWLMDREVLEHELHAVGRRLPDAPRRSEVTQ